MTKPKANSKRPEKLAAIQEIDSFVAGADFCFILNYGGLTVAAVQHLLYARGAVGRGPISVGPICLRGLRAPRLIMASRLASVSMAASP